MLKRSVLIIALAGLAAAFAACGSGDGNSPAATATNTSEPTATTEPTAVIESTATPESTAPVTATATATATSTPMPTATPVQPVVNSFEGSGDRVLGPIDLIAGAVIVEATHNGSANFIVKIIGDGGQTLTVNTIGEYSGTLAHEVKDPAFFGIEPGEVRIQVEADGDWTLNLTQEFPMTGEALPHSTNGAGDSVVTWLNLEEGTHVVSLTHEGNRNFLVQLIAADGSGTELVVNDIGAYDGQILIKVGAGLLDLKPGMYALAIEADGTWTASID